MSKNVNNDVSKDPPIRGGSNTLPIKKLFLENSMTLPFVALILS